MKIITKSPGHGREVVVGEVVDDTFIKPVHHHHYFKAWKSYGIQESVAQMLRAEGSVKRVRIDVLSHTDDTPKTGTYISNFEDWFSKEIRTKDWGGYGLQRFYPVRRMVKI